MHMPVFIGRQACARLAGFPQSGSRTTGRVVARGERRLIEPRFAVNRALTPHAIVI
jgi:hypothetical protein